jgi:uncharacterized protein (TIGR00369 family)
MTAWRRTAGRDGRRAALKTTLAEPQQATLRQRDMKDAPVSQFQPRDANYEGRVRDSFARQALMRTIGAELARIEPGRVEIALAHRSDLTQQHGYLHAGVTSAIADSAGGYAGYSLFPAGSSVLTVEFKINLLAPAAGERFLAMGEVIKPGRTLTICRLEVTALKGDQRTLIAIGQQTLICLEGTPDR